ncbi:MAG TPA: amidohydrolase family protein [Pseudonocardiaceae bacterium]|nr:amidohydrolase family protein [Pseudonocardiaceae bacterium]
MGGEALFDVLLRGGWVADGTGAPVHRADLGITGNRITAVGTLAGASAGTEVDVTGRYLLPGFVDAHVHADARAADPDLQLAALRQGVTTLVVGQDGVSFAPGSARGVAYAARYFAPINGPAPAEFADGVTVAQLLAHYDRATALNVAYLAPAGTIRAEIMGFAPGAPETGQLTAMRGLVEQALADGAIGLSTGLEYLPGGHADAAELAALCAPVAAAGGVYVTHMRGYEANAWQGLAEVLDIAERSGVAAHVSHLHGPTNMLHQLLAEARAAGHDVTFDAYPYLRGSSILAMVALPTDIQRDGPDELLNRLADKGERARLARDWFPGIEDVLDRITLAHVAAPDWSWTEGQALRDAAAQAGLPAGELVCELIHASGLGAGCVFGQPPTNTDTDVRTLLRHEGHIGGSDGIWLGGHPHPRAYGTFARFLGRHTRELGDWTWGQAALHLSGHPARRFGLAGRGLLRAGQIADVVALDPDTVADRATYAAPTELAVGVDHVLVSGEFALRDGTLTGATPGRGLRRGEDG